MSVTLRYSVHLPDGSSMTMGLTDLTPEQVAVVHWLQAEQAWTRTLAEVERKRLARQRKDAERLRAAEERRLVRIEHDRRIDEATGFRLAALTRHGPTKRIGAEGLVCAVCFVGNYEPDPVEFPCSEYLFARDWGI